MTEQTGSALRWLPGGLGGAFDHGDRDALKPWLHRDAFDQRGALAVVSWSSVNGARMPQSNISASRP